MVFRFFEDMDRDGRRDFHGLKSPGTGAPRGTLYPRSVPHDLNKVDVSGYIPCGRREMTGKSGRVDC